MGDSGSKVTDAELAVLEVLWREPSATVRSIAASVYPAADAASLATVHKLIERLEAKGLVARERSSPAHQFRASVERGDLIGRELEDLAARLCEGSMTPVLTQLAGSAKLSRKEVDMLRKLLDEAAKDGGTKR